LARASALHAEGHRFDSCHLHQKNKIVMENELTNESGIIKIEIQKGDKLVTASMYLENYLKVKELHQISLGDDMIDSLINELKD
jgi:hypothetical protein